MILKKWSLAFAAVMMVAPLSASALGISITNISSTLLTDGDVETINLLLENATAEQVFGLGLGINGYDVGNDGSTLNNHVVDLEFGTGFFGNAAIGVGGTTLAFNNASLTIVPEPGTALPMGLGLAGLAARRR